MKLGRIDDRLINYLSRVFSSEVYYNSRGRRPYAGPVFKFGKFRYFVPLTSRNHIRPEEKDSFLLLDEDDGGLNFSKMIAITQDDMFKAFSFHGEKTLRQLAFMKENNNLIKEMARETYHQASENPNILYFKEMEKEVAKFCFLPIDKRGQRVYPFNHEFMQRK